MVILIIILISIIIKKKLLLLYVFVRACIYIYIKRQGGETECVLCNLYNNYKYYLNCKFISFTNHSCIIKSDNKNTHIHTTCTHACAVCVCGYCISPDASQIYKFSVVHISSVFQSADPPLPGHHRSINDKYPTAAEGMISGVEGFRCRLATAAAEPL